MLRLVPCRRDDPDRLEPWEASWLDFRDEAVKWSEKPIGQSEVPYVPPRELVGKNWLRSMRRF